MSSKVMLVITRRVDERMMERRGVREDHASRHSARGGGMKGVGSTIAHKETSIGIQICHEKARWHNNVNPLRLHDAVEAASPRGRSQNKKKIHGERSGSDHLCSAANFCPP